MLKHLSSRALLLAHASGLILAIHAAPAAAAATVEWRVGPVSLAGGQSAEVGISNPEIFPCTVKVEIRAGAINGRGDPFAMPVLVSTIGSPDIVPAGRGAVARGGESPDASIAPVNADFAVKPTWDRCVRQRFERHHPGREPWQRIPQGT